jgi:hypothetical protein
MGIAAIAALVTPAGAATLQVTTTIPAAPYADLTGSTSKTISASDLVISLPVSQFDTSVYGPLTSANINFNTSYELSFDNGTDGGGQSLNLGGNLTISGNGYSGAGNGAGNGGPPGSHFDLLAPISDSTTISASNDPAFQALQGNGNATFEWAEFEDVPVQSFTGGDAQFSRLDGGSVVVTYTYVPEPTSIGLLAVGSLMLLRRCRARTGASSN